MPYSGNNKYMDVVAKLGWNPVNKHQIQPAYGDKQADAGRGCRNPPRETKFLDAKRVQGKLIFLVELTTSSIGTCTLATPISCQILYTNSISKENAFWRFYASPTRAFKVLATRALRHVAGRGIKWKPCFVRREIFARCRRTHRVRLSTQSTSVASAVGTSTVYVGKRIPNSTMTPNAYVRGSSWYSSKSQVPTERTHLHR